MCIYLHTYMHINMCKPPATPYGRAACRIEKTNMLEKYLSN